MPLSQLTVRSWRNLHIFSFLRSFGKDKQKFWASGKVIQNIAFQMGFPNSNVTLSLVTLGSTKRPLVDPLGRPTVPASGDQTSLENNEHYCGTLGVWPGDH